MADLSANEKAVEALAKRIYDSQAPRSAPPFEDAPAMIQYTLKESALGLVNDVLELFTPISPDLGAVIIQMEMCASELGAMPVLTGRTAKQSILRALAEATSFGEAKTDGED